MTNVSVRVYGAGVDPCETIKKHLRRLWQPVAALLPLDGYTDKKAHCHSLSPWIFYDALHRSLHE
jgi:hypothetical protein